MGEPGHLERIDQAAAHIRAQLGERPVPRLGIVLGSGLGALADGLGDPIAIPYGTVPHFPVATVAGHKGRMVAGTLAALEAGQPGVSIIALQGRFHLYEGYAPADVVLPLRALARLGVEAFVITNAAGGINPTFKAGDLMAIRDHINLSGFNPLVGPHVPELGARFPDMSEAYDARFRALLHETASELGIHLQEGVYTVLSGPSYETPAEVRLLQRLGCDACGMSTIPEVIALRQMGARVLGISLISNLAAGISPTPLTHAEVMETGQRTAASFARLVRGVVPRVLVELGE